MQSVGDHHLLIKNVNSQKLIIFFTATGAKVKEFNFWKVGHELAAHANILLVNGWVNSWYQDGVKGLGADLPTTIETIQTWAKAQGVSQIYCAGQSMGGYGALLFSGYLNAKAIAFGAETILDIPHSQYERKADRSIPILHKDLSQAFSNGLDAVLIAGEQDPLDVLFAQNMQKVSGVSVYTMRRVGHGPAGYLRNRDRLLPLLIDWIDGKPFPHMEEFGNALQYSNFPTLYYQGWCASRDLDDVVAEKALKQASTLYPAAEEVRRLLGDVYQRQKRYVDALEQYSVAYAIQPRAVSFLGVATNLRLMGEFAQSRYIYLQLLKLWPSDAKAHYGLGLCYLKLGDNANALAQFEHAAKLVPKNETFRKRVTITKNLIKKSVS